MNRNAQAGTEFLITYGFMILSVSIVVFGLFYFGIFDITMFLPKKCTLPPGITCIDHKAEHSNITIVLLNNMGNDITVLNMSATNCRLINPGEMKADRMSSFFMNCSNLGQGRYKSAIHITFRRKDTSLIQNWIGELITRVPSNGTYY
jgi:hypothetical protein